MIHPLDTARAARLASAIGARALTHSAPAQAAETGLRAAWSRDPVTGRPVMRWSRSAPPTDARHVCAEPVDTLIVSALACHESLRAASYQHSLIKTLAPRRTTTTTLRGSPRPRRGRRCGSSS